MQAVAAPICTSGNIFLSITGRTIQFPLIGLGKALLEMQSSDHVQMLSAISSPPVRSHLAEQPEHTPMLLAGGNTAMLDTGEGSFVAAHSQHTGRVLRTSLETRAKTPQYKFLQLGWAPKSPLSSEAMSPAFQRCCAWTSHPRLWPGVRGHSAHHELSSRHA